MQSVTSSKVTAEHLNRKAYLYVRQSTLRQVAQNTESTKRQYGLRQRALALGWQDDQIVVIDKDLGRSAGAASDREGFAELVAEVGMGRAGIVLGLEVSRLARNSTDWHRLLEICALFKTLILDEDGIYDPAHFNDRLLLGLKGTMSEAELYVIRSRLRGGLLNKARRGELRCKLPIGFVYDQANRVVLDPDQQIQESIRLLFSIFDRTGAGYATVKHFEEHDLLFPVRLGSGPSKGEVVWQRLGLWRALFIIHNPCYAGAYVYGRRRTKTLPGGRTRVVLLPREEWTVLLLDAHEGYITWAAYERNQKQLKKTSKSFGQDRRHGPPREGAALLQGLAICGLCGTRMTVHYRKYDSKLLPVYRCEVRKMKHCEPGCQCMHGEAIDAAVGSLLVELMTPMTLELSLAVQDEIKQSLDKADRLRSMQVESAQYEVDLARQRYMQVDPSRRLVADSLEANWNEKLRDLEGAREDYERGCKADKAQISDRQRERIKKLANDFPALWNDPLTPNRERKRMVALLIEDVTIIKRDKEILVSIRFRGGRTQVLEVPAPIRECDRRRTDPETVALIDALLNEHADSEIATILTERGIKTGVGDAFTARSVQWVKTASHLKSFRQRQLAKGMLTSCEIARQMGITRDAVTGKLKRGELRARRTGAKGHWVFWPLDQQPIDAAAGMPNSRMDNPDLGPRNSLGQGAV